MEQKNPAVEFETEVQGDGTLRLPKSIAARLRKGIPYTVRIAQGSVPRSLRVRNVTEHEIETIAALQMEHRENVIRFLRAGGSMSGNMSFRLRGKALFARKA